MPHNSTSSSFLGRLSARSSFISPKDVKVVVQLLNDSDSISNEFKRSQPAQAILDYICELRNIREKDFLGLRYQDHNKHRYWVDLSRPIAHIAKQFKSDSLALRLRFRYYPAEPSHLRESVSRYQLFMQLQRDLLHGRLYCLQSQAAELAALILQAQLGDYNEAVHKGNYVSQYKLLLKQTPHLEERIAEIHKSLRGKATPVAELEFLEKASRLDTYGFDPYTVKDPKDSSHAVYLGVSHKGILIFHGSQKVHHIPWSYLSKVDYTGKELYIYPIEAYVPPISNGSSDGKTDTNQTKDRKSRLVLKYHCPSSMFAKHLWNHILSQQAFFNEQSVLLIKPKFSKPRIPLLSRGSTFRFPSRRVLREIENADILMENEHVANGAAFVRFELPRQEPRGDQPWLNKYHTLPNMRTNHNNNERLNIDQNSVEDPIVKNISSQSDAEPTLTVIQSVPSTSTGTNEALNSTKNELKPQDTTEMQNSNVPEPEGSHDDNATSKEPTVSLLANTSSNADVKKCVPLKNGSVRCANDRSHRLFTWCTNLFFSTFLFMLIVLVFLIAVFERSGDTDWVRNTGWLSHVQHSYYEPAR
ncbi:hypothetical protein Angca_005350, partial [Angiostrongylus cantonensis]